MRYKMKSKEKKQSPVGAFIKGIEAVNPSVNGCSSVELVGNKRVIVEEATGILEYEAERVRINTKAHTVVIDGAGLTLESYSGGIIVFDGKIRGVCLE